MQTLAPSRLLRRTRTRDYRVAARCFDEAIERYREQVFAHYYLAKAHEMIGGHADKVAENMRLFEGIIARNEFWSGHAGCFGLTVIDRIEAPAMAHAAVAEPALAAR